MHERARDRLKALKRMKKQKKLLNAIRNDPSKLQPGMLVRRQVPKKRDKNEPVKIGMRYEEVWLILEQVSGDEFKCIWVYPKPEALQILDAAHLTIA